MFFANFQLVKKHGDMLRRKTTRRNRDLDTYNLNIGRKNEDKLQSSYTKQKSPHISFISNVNAIDLSEPYSLPNFSNIYYHTSVDTRSQSCPFQLNELNDDIQDLSTYL